MPQPSCPPSSFPSIRVRQDVAYDGPESDHAKRWISYHIIVLLLWLLLWFLWLVQILLEEIILQHPVPTGAREQPENPQEQPENPQDLGVTAVTVVLQYLMLILVLERSWRNHNLLVLLYPLSSVFPWHWQAQRLVSSVFPWQAQRLVSARFWEQLEDPQVQVEILAATVVVLQCLQFILCHERFRQNHWLVQCGAWAAYYAPLPLAAFAVGVMLRFPCPYWLVAIFFAAAQSDTMAAYSLDDDRKNVRRYAKRALTLAYLGVALPLLQGAPYQRPVEILSVLLGFLVFFLHLMIISGRAKIPTALDLCMVAAEHVQGRSTVLDQTGGSSMGAGGAAAPPPATSISRSKLRCSKAVEEEEKEATVEFEAEKDHLAESDDPGRVVVSVGSLGSRRSAVSGCTTYQDILDLDNCSAGLKDICLSSSLFLLLLRRYHTPQVAEDSSSSSLNLVFKNLMAEKNTVGLNERAFGIVEVQLSLMYDYFFSTHGSPSATSYRLYNQYSVSKLGYLFTILSLVVHPGGDEAATEKPELGTSVYVVYALILLELCQLVAYLTSNWLVVSYMCDLARNSSQHASWLLRVLGGGVFIKAGRKLQERSCWQNKLGQYALVEDFDRTSLKQRLLGRLLGRPQRGTLTSPVALSDGMKAWVFDRALNAEPSTGWTSFLRKMPKGHPDDNLSWALSQETEIHTILIWHIATWFCAKTEERIRKRRSHLGVLSSSKYMVATELSSYCAFLVAFHPELLPTHHTVTASIFHKAVVEAYLRFEGTISPDDRLKWMKTWRVQDDEKTQTRRVPSDQGILMLGARLGRQLKQLNNKWRIMADFWVKMLLLVAQSDNNATAHVQHLAKGGEFVTHIWAILSNAGVHKDRAFIKRNKDERDKSGQAAFPR